MWATVPAASAGFVRARSVAARHELAVPPKRSQPVSVPPSSRHATIQQLLYRHLPTEIVYAPAEPAGMAELAPACARRRHPTTEPGNQARTAWLLDSAATYLQVVGRRAEALTVSEETFTLYRELAAVNCDAHLPKLAMSVNNRWS